MSTHVTTTERLDLQKESHAARDAMLALEEAIDLDQELQVLVKLRASLIKGGVCCIDQRSKQGMRARAAVSTPPARRGSDRD